jgi:NitT/TauT family transport system ATP-binding protein
MRQRARIEFDRVRKDFDAPGGTLTAIADVSLSVHDGEFISVIGPSGCGKTTMLNMIAGFQRPTAGAVTLDGRAITRPGADRGVIFQDHGLFPWLTVQ